MTKSTSSEVGTELVVSSGGIIDAQAMAAPSPEVDVNAYDAIVETGMVSRSGIRVNRDAMLQLPTVYQIVEMISGDLAKMKLCLMHEVDGVPAEQRESDTYFRFAHQPNRYQHAVRFWRLMWENRLIWGRAYAAIIRNQRGVQELLPLLPDRTYLDRLDDGTQVYYTEIDGTLLWLDYSEVFHLQGITDLYTSDGRDPLRQSRETTGKALARINFASTFFRHGGRTGGILELPSSMPKPQRDNQERSFRRVYESTEEAFRTVVLRSNAKFHAAQATLQETQMIESGVEDARELCRFWNLNPSRVGIEGGRTYNSKTEDNRDYLDTTLAPHMSYAIAESEEKTLTASERRFRRRWFKYDTSALLQMSLLDRYRAYQIGIASEFLAPNEARRAEDMPPRAGGDRFGNPAINPAAHIEMIEGICNRQSQIMRDRLNRRKTPADGKFVDRSREFVAQNLQPAINAYCEVFGGEPEAIAAAIASKYVAAIVQGTETETILYEVLPCPSPQPSKTTSPESSSLAPSVKSMATG